MRIKIFILKLIFVLILFSQNSFAKSLPPGAGAGDVPDNVLILLDTSGSMSYTTPQSSDSFFYPGAMAVDANGDIYAAQKDGYGIKKITYDTEAVDRSFGLNGIYYGEGVCGANYVKNMQIYNGYLYVTSEANNSVFRINLATGDCDWREKNVYQAQSLSIRNNILYGFGPANPPRGKKSNVVRNLLTNKNVKKCKQSDTPLYMNASFTLDASGKNMYVWDYNKSGNNKRESKIYRYPIDSDGCFKKFPSSNVAFSDEKSIDVINGREHTISKWKVSGNFIDREIPRMEAHPTNDDILYITYSDSNDITVSNTGSRIFKLTMNSTRDGGTYEHVGEYSISQQSNAGKIFVAQPRGITIDNVNNRLIVGNYFRHGTTVLALNFSAEIGSPTYRILSGLFSFRFVKFVPMVLPSFPPALISQQ